MYFLMNNKEELYMGAIEQKIQDKSQKINAKHEQIQETAKKGLDKIVDKIKSQSEMEQSRNSMPYYSFSCYRCCIFS